MSRKRPPLVINGETVDLDAPGLKLVKRKNGEVQQYWAADATEVGRRAIKQGFPKSTVRLHLDITRRESVAHLEAKCKELQNEVLKWLCEPDKGPKPEATIEGLIRLYRTSPDSPYRGLRQGTQRCYDDWCRTLERQVGKRWLNSLSGTDFRKWFLAFMAPATPGGPPRVRLARGCVRQMLPILLIFGAEKMQPNCKALYDVLKDMVLRVPVETLRDWQASKPAKIVMTFDHATAIVRAGIAKGAKRYRSVALGVAAQFEFTISQIDVLGEWVPLTRRALSKEDIVRRGKVWRPGLCYEHFASGTLAIERSKTGVAAPFDVSAYPLMLEALASVPEEERHGPVVIGDDGVPISRRYYVSLYNEVTADAGVAGVWNARARHGGITEAHDAGANLVDIGKHAQHSNTETTVRHYIVPDIDTTRRVAAKRAEHRKKKKDAS